MLRFDASPLVIGVGIIGAGYWGRKLAAEYLDAEKKGKLKLVKVCDSSLAALGALQITKETAKLRSDQLTQEVKAIMVDPAISAVHLATPNNTHFTLAKMALEAGKHVLVEKPMTLNSHEADQLVGLAGEKRRVVEVGHLFRFNQALKVASEMLRNEDLGTIYYLRVQWTDEGNYPERDIIYDLGPHPVDVLNMLLGTWPDIVTGITKAYRNAHNDVAYIFAEYPNDILAHIELSWLHPRKVREITIVGSNASLIIDCVNQRLLRHSSTGDSEIPIVPTNTIACEIDHFMDKIQSGDLTVDETGPRTIETLDAVSASMWKKVPTIIKREQERRYATE